MKPMAVLCALAGLLIWSGCGDVADRRGPAPADVPAAVADHSAEVCRRIDSADEIVAVLGNGATVIARRMPSPVVSVYGCVRAGSMHEGEWLGGGLSHLLEHIVAGGDNDRRTAQQNRDLLEEIGNNSNALTGPDRTMYFVNTTREHLDAAVDLVTGWMLTAHITAEEYERERQVVQREMEMDSGDPDWVFYHQTLRNRYLFSPARVPVIGEKSVVQRITRDDLYRWYKRAYQPNNMVFAVVGDIEPETMLRTVRKYLAGAPAGPVLAARIDDEPPPVAPRTVTAAFPSLGEARLQLAFPTVRLTHPDLYALDVLAVALGQGESSLLVEELRDKRKLVSAVSVFSDTPHYVDGTFQIDMRLPPEKIGAATAAALEIVERIRTDGLAGERIARAKAQLRVARAMAMQRAESVAESLIADCIATGDHRFSDRYVERVERVTVEQIKAVAAKYLDRSVLLTSILLPQETSAGGPGGAERRSPTSAPAATAPAAHAASGRVVMEVLPDGTTLLVRKTGGAPVVAIRMYAAGGLTAEDERSNGLGNLAMQTALRGTETRSAAQIAAFFDSIGAQMSAACGNTTWSWSTECLRDDLPAALEVFADVALGATFPDAEVETVRKRALAAIDSQDADWFAQTVRFFRQTYFGPRNSPYQFMPLGTRTGVERFTAEQVRQWYRQKVLRAPRVLAIFGDIDIDSVKMLAARYFRTATPPAETQRRPRRKAPATMPAAVDGPPRMAVERVVVRKSDNPQTAVMVGFEAPTARGDAAGYALTLAKTLTSGFSYPTGYLFEALRGEGLVYDVNAFTMQAVDGVTPGALVVYAACEARNADRVVDVILENMARLQGSPRDMGQRWFSRARKLIVTSDALDHETPAAQADTAALDYLFGCGADYHGSFAAGIAGVAPEDVRRLAARFLNRCTIVVNTDRPDLVKTAVADRLYKVFKPVEPAGYGVRHDVSGAAR